MVNSRNKGAAFERDIVKALKLFCSNYDAQIHISRNFEQQFKEGQADINFLNYAIECKRYGEGKGLQASWWNQVCNAAGEDRIPVLVFKYNRADIQVALPLWAILEDEPKDNEKIFICKWPEFIHIIKRNKIFQAYVETR